MRRKEEVRLVVIEFGSLMLAERVLNGQLVESELLGEHVQLVLRGRAHVDPNDCVGFGEEVGDVRDRKVLGLDHPVAVHAGGRRVDLFVDLFCVGRGGQRSCRSTRTAQQPRVALWTWMWSHASSSNMRVSVSAS